MRRPRRNGQHRNRKTKSPFRHLEAPPKASPTTSVTACANYFAAPASPSSPSLRSPSASEPTPPSSPSSTRCCSNRYPSPIPSSSTASATVATAAAESACRAHGITSPTPSTSTSSKARRSSSRSRPYPPSHSPSASARQLRQRRPRPQKEIRLRQLLLDFRNATGPRQTHQSPGRHTANPRRSRHELPPDTSIHDFDVGEDVRLRKVRLLCLRCLVGVRSKRADVDQPATRSSVPAPVMTLPP
jgi:hypothetical protein